MSIQEIEKRILEEARTEAAKIKEQASSLIQQLEKAHAQNQATLKSQSQKEAERESEAVKRSRIVPARLAARKAVLQEKQKILGKIYREIKREKKLSAAEADKLREDSEIKASQILFGNEK